MNYSQLNLKINNKKNTFKIQDQWVEVAQYLPIKDKVDLIDIALQRAETTTGYNELLLEMFFNLNIVFMYTNLEFSAEELDDLEKLYDELESNGVILDVIGAMEDDEYNCLLDNLELMKENNLRFKGSTSALLQSIIADLPKNAEAAAEIVNNFDPEKYQAVLDFAKAANGGRPIN